MTGKSINTILLAIIAVLTLALAVMSIFLFTANNASKENNDGNVSANTNERVVPTSEQAEFNLYGLGNADPKAADALFNIKSSDDYPNNFLMTSISIVYDGGKKNELLEKRKLLLESTYLSEFKQTAIEYFRAKSFEELQAPDAMQNARRDLKDLYNGIASENPDEKIILKIVFNKWIIQ